MKKLYITAFALALTATCSAESAVDAYQLSQSDLRGSARFVSMGGAFTALGGDISTLNQNPAGIGIYRKSEIGFTLDINMTSSDVSSNVGHFKEDKTHTFCNNFGYIGSVSLDSDVMKTFNWGVSYSRVASFNRSYRMGGGDRYPILSNSITNYIASFTNRDVSDLEFGGGDYPDYNPYFGDADWLSVLAHQSYLISNDGKNSYNGLWQQGSTSGDMQALIKERGYVDEYSIDFGGNICDVVYWGLGFGITDISYNEFTIYDEELQNACVPNTNAGWKNGNGGFTMENHKLITGSGFNFKTGLIFKPINEFRLGIAVHTPTYYKLTQDFKAYSDYSFDVNGESVKGSVETELGYFDWKLQTPWKLMFGAAAVIGGRGIISMDYEYAAYDKMDVSDRYDIYDYSLINEDISTYYKPQHTVRIGGEFRVTPDFSLRAGYNYQKSGVEKDAQDGNIEVYTTGTNPAYSMDKKTEYITFGLGYKYQAFYADLAYVYKHRSSYYYTHRMFNGYKPYKHILDTEENNIVISLGFKF